MVIVRCPVPGCTYSTSDEEAAVVAALLNIHALTHAQATAAPPPKLDRPKIDVGVEEEVWNGFVRRWEAFRSGSGLNETTAPSHLFQCASEALGDLMLKNDPQIQLKPEGEILSAMRLLAVIPVAKGVLRAELMQLQQAPDEQFRTFAARVKGKAETCGFKTVVLCECKRSVTADYTQETVRDVLLAGIADIDIRREALSTADIQHKTINEVIAFVEGREMARNATPTTSLSAFSTFKRRQVIPHQSSPPVEKSASEISNAAKAPSNAKPIPCPDCGKHFHPFKQRANGSWNKKPHTKCLQCWRSDRPKPMGVNAALSTDENDSGHIVQISSIERKPLGLEAEDQRTTVSLKQKILNKGEWRRAKVSKHPSVTFQLRMLNPINTNSSVTVNGVADTGAQSNLWGLSQFRSYGFSTKDLSPVKTQIRAANKNPINVIGACRAQLSGQSPEGKTISCITDIYISDSVSEFYISYDTMVDLLILDPSFPVIGGCTAIEQPTSASPETTTPAHSYVRALYAGCTNPPSDMTASCTCPQREMPPPRPTNLPFPPIPENNEKMKQWLLDRYGKSSFNTCPHRPLPCMTGPPIEIHIDDSAKPRCCHTPAAVPLHWQEKVKNDLLRDEALGVIEKVPYGEPVTWCHRMVVTRKHDGSPRRTVDLSPLNKHCKRELFPSESPFHLARRVPGDTWKTVTDCWNGYHSVPLRELDRHLTTFITPFGRWRYTRAPQGFLSSGDGYNRRLDAILSNFQRKERCVDDTVFHDTDLEDHWWRTIDFLTTIGAAGVVLNPDKFQFAQREVNFAGFQISEDRIKPLPKYIEAIRSFPRPTSTTDIRSWFGLVNQVANYAQLRDNLEMFRPFLSPKYKFFWSSVLEKAFQESKEAIIEAIYRGVEIFDMNRPTCLRPDWSKNGIGYFLLQQHCDCTTDLPNCCSNGWHITLAGSRFLNGPEQRYAPVEGEALAVAWGLEQTRYFTQGCPNLLVVTDHKPLTKIFGDRTLDEISNTRLFRLKQRTLPWHFRIKHMPGKTNCAADAASRYPAPPPHVDAVSVEVEEEIMVASSMCREVENFSSISWELVARETAMDVVLSCLLKAISQGHEPNSATCSEYAQYQNALYVTDGVILYKDRIVVPPSLRRNILNNLHAAHQGVSSMKQRAQSIIFWPGISKDIERTRAMCTTCNKNAPSQASLPSVPATPPSTPFEQIFADFFDFGGHHYLIIGDRLSGWSEIFSTPAGSSKAGANGLISCLRSVFSTFGVPDEISSDGGPEFTASTTREFFKRWGVRHRRSSAYYPQSNGRAEVAVKSAKRLLRENVSPSGSLDNDKLLRALLQLRNTPDPDCCVSPAQIIFGRPIRDAFAFMNRLKKFSNHNIRPIWRDAWSAKESALRARFVKTSEDLNKHSKSLGKLIPGNKCFIQNQTGNSPKRWDRTGVVMETKPHDQYVVKVDGSGRLTTRNRRFLRNFEPASMEIQCAPPSYFPGDIESGQPCNVQLPTPSGSSQSDAPCVDADEVVSNDPPEDDHTDLHESVDRTAPASRPPPLALTRLLPTNKPGLKEAIVAPEHGGRKLRSSDGSNRHMNLGGI